MRATRYPFQMAGGVPVITAPPEIDTTTAGQLRAILLGWQSRRHTIVVVDMTGTQFCDSAGLRELAWAHKRAVADGGGLRLITPAEGAVARIFTVTGLDCIIPRFATVEQALAQEPGTANRPLSRSQAPKSAATPARSRGPGRPPADSRNCQPCGAVFAPRRGRARSCRPDGRPAWTRGRPVDPSPPPTPLHRSITAMSEATAQLPALKPWDQSQALAAIGEAVWWITMVDATLVRHHQQTYETVLAAHTPAGRQQIEQTLAGLRFVRNLISREAGLDELIAASTGARRITGWTWKPLGEPALTWLPPRAQAWERTRYRAYQARLAGHTVGATFGLAVTFLTLTGADAASTTDTSGKQSPAAAPAFRIGVPGDTASP